MAADESTVENKRTKCPNCGKYWDLNETASQASNKSNKSILKDSTTPGSGTGNEEGVITSKKTTAGNLQSQGQGQGTGTGSSRSSPKSNQNTNIGDYTSGSTGTGTGAGTTGSGTPQKVNILSCNPLSDEDHFDTEDPHNLNLTVDDEVADEVPSTKAYPPTQNSPPHYLNMPPYSAYNRGGTLPPTQYSEPSSSRPMSVFQPSTQYGGTYFSTPGEASYPPYGPNNNNNRAPTPYSSTGATSYGGTPYFPHPPPPPPPSHGYSPQNQSPLMSVFQPSYQPSGGGYSGTRSGTGGFIPQTYDGGSSSGSGGGGIRFGYGYGFSSSGSGRSRPTDESSSVRSSHFGSPSGGSDPRGRTQRSASLPTRWDNFKEELFATGAYAGGGGGGVSGTSGSRRISRTPSPPATSTRFFNPNDFASLDINSNTPVPMDPNQIYRNRTNLPSAIHPPGGFAAGYSPPSMQVPNNISPILRSYQTQTQGLPIPAQTQTQASMSCQMAQGTCSPICTAMSAMPPQPQLVPQQQIPFNTMTQSPWMNPMNYSSTIGSSAFGSTLNSGNFTCMTPVTPYASTYFQQMPMSTPLQLAPQPLQFAAAPSTNQAQNTTPVLQLHYLAEECKQCCGNKRKKNSKRKTSKKEKSQVQEEQDDDDDDEEETEDKRKSGDEGVKEAPITQSQDDKNVLTSPKKDQVRDEDLLAILKLNDKIQDNSTKIREEKNRNINFVDNKMKKPITSSFPPLPLHLQQQEQQQQQQELQQYSIQQQQYADYGNKMLEKRQNYGIANLGFIYDEETNNDALLNKYLYNDQNQDQGQEDQRTTTSNQFYYYGSYGPLTQHTQANVLQLDSNNNKNKTACGCDY